MSVNPRQNLQLKVFEGSTLDRTFSVKTGTPLALKDLTGWSAAMQVRKDFDSTTVLLDVTSGALTPGPNAKAIVLGGALGTVRIYVGSNLTAALNAADFTLTRDEGDVLYTGVWDLELTNPASEAFRYFMGPVLFSREVTHA